MMPAIARKPPRIVGLDPDTPEVFDRDSEHVIHPRRLPLS